LNDSRRLRINAGYCSRQGKRDENQDFLAVHVDPANGVRGDVAAIADGVSHGKAGRIAAELAIREFLDAHYALSPTGGVQRNAGRALQSINSWLHGMAMRDQAMQHASTTLTALIFAGRDAHVVHVGDTRAYLLHDEQLLCLTEDHTLRQPEREHVLIRALGLEPSVRADFRVQPLRTHDRLMLCSDGVHGVLSHEKLRALLLRRHAPEEEAERIVEAALEAGSQDNASCIVIDVLQVPEISAPELQEQLASLPIIAPPEPGEMIDGFRMLTRLSDGRYSRLLHARDEQTGAEVVMKFPQHNVTTASTHHLAFVREAWVGARLHSPWLGETIEVAPERQTRLYSVMPFYSGETLEERLRRRPAVTYAEGMAIAQKLTKAIAVLHRAGIIHRDVKPENILLEADGGLRLIDLGVVRLPLIEDFPGTDIPGTPSYMAPELFDGRPGDEASDQFALAVTLYRMWSGRYPYGEIEPFSRPRFLSATPLARHRPDLPAWVGHFLSRALQPDPAARFGDIVELSMEIDSGMSRAEPRVLRRLSLYERDPLRFWKVLCALLLIALLASLAAHAS